MAEVGTMEEQIEERADGENKQPVWPTGIDTPCWAMAGF